MFCILGLSPKLSRSSFKETLTTAWWLFKLFKFRHVVFVDRLRCKTEPSLERKDETICSIIVCKGKACLLLSQRYLRCKYCLLFLIGLYWKAP